MARKSVYERKAMQGADGKYIYPDLHQHSFWLDDRAELRVQKALSEKKWTLATLVRVALDEYIKKLDDDNLTNPLAKCRDCGIEQKIKDLFENGGQFFYEGEIYKVIKFNGKEKIGEEI